MTSTPAVTSGYALGFGNLDAEVEVPSLPVQGRLPSWLDGTLLRNGPALFDVGQGTGAGRGRSLRHWFDGQAMLHRFTISDGTVSYRNRLLDTPSCRSMRERGRIGYHEFATDPCGSIFTRYRAKWSRGRSTPNAGVNVAMIGDRPVALTETIMPVEFDAQTLATVGVLRWADDQGGAVATAHPHQDPDTGDLVNFSLAYSRTSEYRVHRVRDGAAPSRELIGAYRTTAPGYLHSFAITERYVVLVLFPLVVNPLALLLRDRPFIANFRWRPELGTRIVVMDLRDGRVRGTYRSAPCFAFHHVNAFDDGAPGTPGEAVVLDLCSYDDASVVDALYLDRLRGAVPVRQPFPTRLRVDLASGEVTARRLTEHSLELPQINYDRCNGRPYRYAYGVGALDPEGSNFLDQLVKLDTATGRVTVWREPDCYPGEPVFVPSPSRSSGSGSAAEDDGVILSVVLDAAAGRSMLLVLDAANLTELARAGLPHAVPFGFHGRFDPP
jgi:carotenoid cleavage dioxygenase-like enzyme